MPQQASQDGMRPRKPIKRAPSLKVNHEVSSHPNMFTVFARFGIRLSQIPPPCMCSSRPCANALRRVQCLAKCADHIHDFRSKPWEWSFKFGARGCFEFQENDVTRGRARALCKVYGFHLRFSNRTMGFTLSHSVHADVPRNISLVEIREDDVTRGQAMTPCKVHGFHSRFSKWTPGPVRLPIWCMGACTGISAL